ncbi:MULTISPECIES: polysaccharide biosynthesis tyrosine autokinase [unclassified Lentimonas]|uniref:GumC family protein n=1 Tax=unclassified Lentimonas TaxID=2630993 RepID=UPI0013295C74|nr:MULTISPECIES: polysaccharide biosynthesis tyrosine autokinase [unclassified Lentimonas]CAA6679483.1 Capsular polysaccharide synthesis enzyme CpsD, exopolysaccharide synthesis [Lentimonas sp. CC4]CAA6687154.1 Capsular polysaccharide synthesis enzyme CpsD, exopolysaccharide synthesis [Lentimonas sp. CC6]CAA7075499.1 Capsular polysaccharide synthesis enzyme CpsD, exopolysaccharide synthesis [Lentimonas sp. CC4]CAA7170266.1 Capsular polysaccharide synthesis enzyme CpsD, exopolysaccharide synthes
MKNDYVRGAPDLNSGGYGGGGYGGGSYGYGYGSGYGDGDSYGGGGYGSGAPQRSFKDYFLMFRERIWYLIVAFFIIFSGSILYTFNKTKVYTAVAMVQLLRDDPTAMASMEIEQNQIRGAEDLNTQISVLNSGKIIQGVERRLQDDERERFMAPYADALSLSGPLSPVEILGKYRKVMPQRMSLMIGVAYTHPDPVIAARVANLFADEFINYNLTLNIDGSMKAVEDLRIRADQQKERVEELELKLAEYREDNNAVSLDTSENIAGAQLASLNEMKLSNKNVYDNLETRWNLIESYRREGKDLWELSFIAEQPRVSNLLERISGTKIQISSLSKRYREKHPVMIQQLQTLQESEAELVFAVQNSVNKIGAAYAESKSNFELASQRLAEKEAELIELSKTRVEYSSLLRELDVQQGFLQALVARMTQEKAQVNLKNPNSRVIDEALPPLRHSSPNIVMNLAAGLFGGVAAGVGLIFLVAFLDDRVKSAFDIEGTIGLPMLGVVPRIKKLDSNSKAQAVASNVDRHVTETFRSIHSALKLNDDSKNAKVIVTTSTVPGEGKSFISSNLALTFANHGEKTLLLDGDLRLPNVARSLQLENEFGVLDHIEKDVSLDEVIIKEVYPNLDVLPTGGKSKNPTQVLNSSKFEAMLADLRDRYDRIVIDSPPLAAVSDALNLLPLADGVIYVIKFNTVKRKTAVVNVRRMWESNTPVFGAILNNITSSLSNYYYSSYSDKAYQDYYIHQDEEFEEELAGSVEPEMRPKA